MRHTHRELTGSIVHDVNNMLTVIVATATRLAGELGDAPALHDKATTILEASHRASGLARELLGAARGGALRREAFDIHEAVEDASRLLATTIGPGIEVRLRLAARAPTGFGSALQLQSALLNLGLNARDAMPDGGTISITTRDVVLDADECRHGPFELAPGDDVELVVSDDGAGMDETVARRAFEPFFTTKGAGKGTGLGLVAVRKAVTEHGGAIFVDSQLGRGTTFRLYLPVVARA
jgi:signal transduction histidine kinase